MPLPFIIGGLAAVGSAITTVAGTAAAVGTAVAGTAAAVGTAAAGTAVGGAVVGAATTVGTAVAGSAVGTAAVGAMTTVGTAVGAAAGAASAVPVIGGAAGTVATVAGTSAGAAAVGTIATTGTIGVANGVSGVTKLSEASDLKDAALLRYEEEKEIFELEQDKTNDSLMKLGKEKLKIWKSFERFSIMYSKIKNPPTISADVKQESIAVSAEDLEEIKAVAISAKSMLSGGVASVAGGNLISVAVSGGIISAGATASTGTAISALSGAAATNATLAAFGGGSLAVNGLGMAGGRVVLGALNAAPALMISGIMLNGQASKALESAKNVDVEVDNAVKRMQQSEKELGKVKHLSDSVLAELERLNAQYLKRMDTMEAIVQRETDYNMFTCTEQKALHKTTLCLTLIKNLSTQNILDNNGHILEKEVQDLINNTRSEYNLKLL